MQIFRPHKFIHTRTSRINHKQSSLYGDMILMSKIRHPKMPKRLWTLPEKTLNFKEKRLLAFIWWCSPKGCHCWNSNLGKRFKKSPRTISRWLHHLHKLELIAIGHPDGSGRTIWPRYQAHRKPIKAK